MDWAKDWIYDAYDQDETATDGGEPEVDYALLEVTITSTSLNVYE